MAFDIDYCSFIIRKLVDAKVLCEVDRLELVELVEYSRPDHHETIVIEPNILHPRIELKEIACKIFDRVRGQIQIDQMGELLEFFLRHTFHARSSDVDALDLSKIFSDPAGDEMNVSIPELKA